MTVATTVGIVAGLHVTSGDPQKQAQRQRQALEASGAGEVLNSLPRGAATLLGDGVSGAALTTGTIPLTMPACMWKRPSLN